MSKRRLLAQPPTVPDNPPEGRAVQLPSYLRRILPAYGAPQWLQAAGWRQFVRNQSLAIVMRDTLLNNIKSLEWDVVAVDPEEASNPEVKQGARYYRDLFEKLDGDFDIHVDMMGQDFLDLPFGACSEVIREEDHKLAPIVAVEHIDAATLWPTLNDQFPVMQQAVNVPSRPVVFPDYSVNRMIYSARPELLRKGWGMAPPEKVYLAMEMLYRGDTYYWKLLLDTPAAGILDLLDMTEDAATKWIGEFRTLFQGIDGFKVPVLYEHTAPASWIPFGRPPIEMMYDKSMLYYAQVLAAGYGLRISDLGLEEARGGGTLAGVIRAERQTRRSGLANVRESFRNYFNRMLPGDPYKILKFVWIERDDEATVARGRALLAMGQAFDSLISARIISAGEGRKELVSLGLMETKLNPDLLPSEPQPQDGAGGLAGLAALLGLGGGQGQGLRAPRLGPLKPPQLEDKVPVSAGGRGDQPQGLASRILRAVGIRRSMPETASGDTPRTPPGVQPGKNPATVDAKELLRRLDAILEPGLARIRNEAEAARAARVRKLVRIATDHMVVKVAPVFRSLDDQALQDFWLPQMNAMTFGEPSELEAVVTRQDEEELAAALDEALADEDWWQLADEWDKEKILDLYSAGLERGAEGMALDVARQLYERGMIRRIPDINFSLKSQEVLDLLDARAGQMVTEVDAATKGFIGRIVTAGVRQGLSSGEVAQAIRDGATAEEVLSNEGFMGDVLGSIMDGLTEMSDARANSISNYEIAWAENTGKQQQLDKMGLTQKAWVHLGDRGITPAGNLHPCPICEANEALGFVEMDYLYETVFEPSMTPPAHPGVCHCTIEFNTDELNDLVAGGDFAPWLGE